MKEVKTQQRYKCDFCKKRSTKSVMELHEKRCFRNPSRFCDFCENNGFTMETIAEDFPAQKVDCIYCSSFNKKQLEEIEAREKKEIPPMIEITNKETIPF